MKILVTGGCGFIGSNFIKHMLDKYPTYKIFNIDKLENINKITIDFYNFTNIFQNINFFYNSYLNISNLRRRDCMII